MRIVPIKFKCILHQITLMTNLGAQVGQKCKFETTSNVKTHPLV